MPFAIDEDRLRSEAGRRAIVLVGIVDIVRVELDLAAEEAEPRGAPELTIAIIGKFAFIHPCSLDIEVYFPLRIISSQSCILFDGISKKRKPATDKASSISPRQHTL